ncbi:enoyl-CoA hydratase/isomerase family protein [Marinobacter sp. 1-3A]|uniref:enoyl-CoA hydratase/isomerase family protein n=1 Tax=Marinobacter sp. 1-3A TaxID=2582920 RepID=UPI001903C095|nr:enoyl-CoA hydratase/isomerase family protein [Marinobacter sp. 1-3A]MBK1874084.1 enoyl-CoA hydratase/isomerase family protein [Marinobacter sp. 1-3A]
MSDTPVLLSRDGQVATITLNRPQHYNALNAPMRKALTSTLAEVEADPTIRVCIIGAAGKGFSAGQDLQDFDYKQISDLLLDEYEPLLKTIHHGNKLYIARVHGQAAGIGAALALTCDLVMMAEDASVYLAFAAIALVPDGGLTWHLLNAMGRHRALAAIIEGKRLDADTCLTHGLANKAVPAENLEQEVFEWASSLAGAAPLAVAGTKRLLREVASCDWRSAVAVEAEEQNVTTKSKDFMRGVQAFVARRTPEFEGN